MFFIPKKIKVGYQERNDTYTNKLAYIIYYDDKGTLRKETSWQGWRDQKIDPDDIDNVPTSGFVLNKTAGGRGYSSWDTRKTYCRVYDPRGFEFEIDISNLLYLLENTSSIVGKGLEGEFVYGWEGKELVLIPTSAPDYAENQKQSDMMFKADFLKVKELKEGVIYTKKNGERLAYLGRDRYFTNDWDRAFKLTGGDFSHTHKEYNKKMFWFYRVNSGIAGELNEHGFETFSSLPRMYKPESEELESRYAEIMAFRDEIDTYNPIVDIIYKDVTPYDLNQSTKISDYVISTDDYWGLRYHGDDFIKKGEGLRDAMYAIPRSKYYLERNELDFHEPLNFIKKYNLRKIVKIIRYADKK